MKKFAKILTVILLVAMIVMAVSPVFATNPSGVINQIEQGAKKQVDTSKLATTIGVVIAYLRNAAIIIGAIILVILGIKYMMGSVEEKADYKKSFVPLIVGIVVVMAATSIASFLFSMFAS